MNLSWAGPQCEHTNSVIITPMFDLLWGIKRKSRQIPFSMLKEKEGNGPTRELGLVPAGERM
jgi:hypothetical protein